ncbi:MAG: dipeptidase [Phycisphaerales bacterium]|nr:dipeptidase [Phycisphaerales bacterium]
MPTWFDAHLDLAYLAVSGRNMLAPLAPASGPHPPAAVTLPALREGGVRFALATIFTEAGGKGPEGYPAGNVDRAAAVGRAQMEAYLTWRDGGEVGLDLRRVFRCEPGVGQIRGGMGVAEVVRPTPEQVVAALPREPWMHLGILVECADPIRDPSDLKWWVERGVVAIGLTWARGSRYAAGNGAPSCSSRTGLTPLGRDMVQAMDALGVVHDVSHLSWRAMDDLLTMTEAAVVASHSNCSALLDGDAATPSQRHLRDEHIREIARRGGVIGVNLFSAFLRPGLTPEKPGRATIAEVVKHVEHIRGAAGGRRCVGLGSDMDGGFGASLLPEHINRPADLARLADALRDRGWSDEDAEDFRWRNWARFWMDR